MDYVWEELLRQQKTLADLLRGDTKISGKDAERRNAPPSALFETQPDSGTPANEVRSPGPQQFAPKLLPTEKPGFSAGELPTLWETTAPAADFFAEQQIKPAASAERRRTQGSRPETPLPAGAGRSVVSAAGLEELPDGSSQVSPESNPVWRYIRLTDVRNGAAADMQALSRAVERDARRYDGGFSIY